MKKILLYLPLFALALMVVGYVAPVASADHAWGSYHWARTVNPFTLKLGDSVTANWDGLLRGAATDWSQSTVLDTVVVPSNSNPRTCKAMAGQVQVCNSKYGSNGWLGIASVWVNGHHITQGTVKLNDTYFSTAKYNTTAWKNLVMCQEIGHTFGLDHQDEDFTNANLGTCMDYTNDPSTNQYPNQHDYDMLDTIYAHLDTITTISQRLLFNAQDIDQENQSTWGRQIRTSADGRGAVYARDFGNGNEVFTFVVWAEEMGTGTIKKREQRQ